MNEFEEKLKKFMKENNMKGEHLSFSTSCHSVQEAAESANASVFDFVKNICLIGSKGEFVVAIVKGEDKVSLSKVGRAAGVKVERIASPEEILELTGYPCGGTPSFGFTAIFLVDERVMEKQVIYSSGGSQNSLLKISPNELLKANNAKVADVRK